MRPLPWLLFWVCYCIFGDATLLLPCWTLFFVATPYFIGVCFLLFYGCCFPGLFSLHVSALVCPAPRLGSSAVGGLVFLLFVGLPIIKQPCLIVGWLTHKESWAAFTFGLPVFLMVFAVSAVSWLESR